MPPHGGAIRSWLDLIISVLISVNCVQLKHNICKKWPYYTSNWEDNNLNEQECNTVSVLQCLNSTVNKIERNNLVCRLMETFQTTIRLLFAGEHIQRRNKELKQGNYILMILILDLVIHPRSKGSKRETFILIFLKCSKSSLTFSNVKNSSTEIWNKSVK